MAVSNPKGNEKVAEHQFWLFQYQSRNFEYRRDYDGLKEKLSKSNLNYADLNVSLNVSRCSKFKPEDWATFRALIKDRDKFIRKYKTEPKDYNTGTDSEKLLSSIDQDSFEYPIANDDYFMKTKIISSNWPHLTVEYDLKEDLDLLIKELTALYELNHLINSPGDTIKYRSLSKKVQSSKKQLLRLQRVSKQGKKRIYPRAVGIWLWDRCQFKSEIGFSKEQVYEKYRLRYENIDSANYHYTGAYEENTHLDRLLRATNKCIEKMEVLPMK